MKNILRNINIKDMDLNDYKRVFAIIIAIISFIFIISIKIMNLLPIKLFVLLIVLDILMYFFILLLSYRRNKYTRIFGYSLSFIFFILSIMGIIICNSTTKFKSVAFNNQVTEVLTYNLITLNDTKYSNFNNKKIGYIKGLNDKVLDSLVDKPIYVIRTDLTDLFNELINKEIDACILENSYLDILSDEVDISSLRIVKSYELENKLEKKEEVKSAQPFNVFLTATNSKTNKIYNRSRSDINILLTINPQTHQVLLTSIPKNYYVNIHGQNSLKEKMNNIGIYGLDVTTKTVGDIFNTEVNYNIKGCFSSVIDLVDLVGGVDIKSDEEFVTTSKDGGATPVKVNVGENHFNGSEALSYAREKRIYNDQEVHDLENQQQILKNIISKILSDKKMLLKYNELLTTLKDIYITDIPESLVNLLIKDELNTNAKWTFKTQVITGVKTMAPTNLSPNNLKEVIVVDDKDLKKAINNINETLNK